MKRHDPWNESIDGVILDLRNRLMNYVPESTDRRPYTRWAEDYFSQTQSSNHAFTRKGVERNDPLCKQGDWFYLSSNLADWRDNPYEIVAALKVRFETYQSNSAGTLCQQYLGLFIYGEEPLDEIPMLRVQRIFKDPFLDIKEICWRYVFPFSKTLFDFVRNRK